MQGETVRITSIPLILKENYLRILVAMFVILLPAIQTGLFLQGFFSVSLFDFIPATDDEVLLWHQTATFHATGFNGGYYTYEEKPAALSSSHFAAHGPFFPMLYGVLATAVGWAPNTGAILNLIFVSLAVMIFVIAARPNIVQLLLIGGVLSTFWLITFAIPDNSQEALHLSFGIILAAVMSLLLRTKSAPSLFVIFALAFLIFAASLFRPFWIILLIPVALIATRGGSWKIRFLAVGAAIALMGLVFIIGVVIAAPYPNFVGELIDTLKVSRGAALKLWIRKLVTDVPFFLGVRDQYLLSVVERYEIIGLGVILAVGVIIKYLRSKGSLVDVVNNNKVTLFILFSLATIMVANLLFYIPYGYQAYRVFAPYLLMAILMVVLEQRYTIVFVFIGINLLCLPIFLTTFRDSKMRNFRFDTAGVKAFSSATLQDIRYDPVQSPWCSTVMIDSNLFCKNLRCDYALAIPPGVGLTMLAFPNRLSAPIKSKYLLLSDKGPGILETRLGEKPPITQITETAYGTLYRNEAAACY